MRRRRVNIKLKPQNLTKHNFSDFGTVIENNREPDYSSLDVDYWSNLHVWDNQETEVSINFGICKKRKPVVEEMERHLNSSEILIPIESSLYIVVGSDINTARENIKLFRLRPGQIVFFKKRIWHAAPFPERKKGRFFVLYKQGTSENDFNFAQLDSRINLELD